MARSAQITRIDGVPEWNERGCDYAEQSWVFTFNRMGKDPYYRLQRIVLGLYAEDAFIGYLRDRNVGHDEVPGRTNWYDVDRFDIMVGGRRCDTKALLVRALPDMDEVASSWYLAVPEDQILSRRMGEDDVYVAVYLVGTFRSTPPDSAQGQLALPCGQHDEALGRWVHVPWEYVWTRPGHEQSPRPADQALGPLELRNLGSGGTRCMLVGTSGPKQAQAVAMDLPPDCSVTSPPFHQLFCVRSLGVGVPTSALSITATSWPSALEHIPGKPGFSTRKTPSGQTELELNGWADIRFYGDYALFAGWITKRELLQYPTVPRFAHDYPPIADAKTANKYCPISELHPMDEMLKW